ncbi:MAG: hypothetical protein A2020_00810 [Lentisphaerae bacterium GWF2_45_14]|nr:MAG: hypothetical protein A2020_00810 [Lentisphaerae bacterium GWF2_45_14]
MKTKDPIKVLIVDDTFPIAKIIERLLEERYRSEIICFTLSDGAAAVKFLDENPSVNIIITDFKMPGMDGISLLRNVSAFHPDTRRVLISGYADIENLTNALNECGIKGFINKPIQSSQLYTIIDLLITDIRLSNENAELQEATRKSFMELLSLVYDIMSELSPRLFDYSVHTAGLCAKIAAEYRMSTEEMDVLATAARLHAISLLGAEEKTYTMPLTNLPRELRQVYLKYPEASSEMLKSAPKLEKEREIIRLHHENIDGSGLFKMLGEEIPFSAKILRICSFYCSSVILLGTGKESVMQGINSKSGKFFDKALVGVFLRTVSIEMGSMSYPVLVCDIKPGMKLGMNIYSKTGGVLLPEGTIFNNINIKRLRIYNEFSPLKEIHIVIKTEPEAV